MRFLQAVLVERNVCQEMWQLPQSFQVSRSQTHIRGQPC